MHRAAILGLGLALGGCATGSADDLGFFTDGGPTDGATNKDAPASDTGCGVGLVTCDDKCVDTAFDRDNCGACGTKCASAEVCKAGKCSGDCGTLTSCAGDSGTKCVNTKTDTANCGACGKVCPTGQLCSDGACAPDCGTSTRCPGATPYCADVKTDVKNCGYCGNACPSGQDCIAGTCGLLCTPPTTKCGGACTNTNTDPMNCGACAAACSVPNATAGCAGGSCTVGTCNAGFGNCDSVATNGCETNTANNVAHCGSCGNACSVANGTAGCSGGSCTVASCSPNFGNCDGSPGNGCEVNLLTNHSHCGSCGNACSGGQTCKSGACATAVSGTFTATVTYSGTAFCPGVGICGNVNYLCTGAASASRTFADPMPSGGKAVTATVRVYGLGCSGGTVFVTLNGVSVGTYAATTSCSCGTCEAPYTVSLNNPAGIPGYVYGGTNTLVIRASASGMCMQRAEIAITAG
jgi:hypothetical protein